MGSENHLRGSLGHGMSANQAERNTYVWHYYKVGIGQYNNSQDIEYKIGG